MLVGCAKGFCRVVALLAAASCWAEAAAPAPASPAFHTNLNAVHSNAIKIPLPDSSVASVSASPGGKHPAGEPHQQFSTCSGDEDCNIEEFCPNSARGGVHGTPACLACRRRRKRCFRDAMCCPGNYCYNGMCVPLEHDHFYLGEIEENIMENFDHGATDFHPKRTTSSSRLHHLKGQEGAVCLRSSDCAEGLCCARHFWSKICKPVLKEGQVCTKHRKKGAHGLEIFQRCNCGDGLTCRLQKDHTNNNSSRLHTCQRH
ncbi:dickkopf-related protein 1 isoform X1 [Pogona vitticeps]